MMRHARLTGVVVLLCASVAAGQAPGFDLDLGGSPFELSHSVAVEPVRPGGTFTIALVWKIPPAHYLYRDQVSVVPANPSAFASFEVALPEGIEHVDELTGKPTRVFTGELRVIVTCRVPARVSPGPFRSSIQVGWQGCGKGVCYRPESRTIPIEVTVAGEPVGGQETALSADALLTSALLALAGGILVSFTPCVFPLIPVTLAVVGVQAGKTGRLRGLSLSSTYVAGIVLVYAALGALAALVGEVTTIDARNVWVRGAGVLIFLALAASMFGLYELRLPSFITRRLSRQRSGGFVGAFAAGVASALVATTCVAAPLIVALTYAVGTGSVPAGVVVGGAFALGMGLLLIAVGTFAGLVSRLTSGPWMVSVQRAMGLLLVAAAVYFLEPVLPQVVWRLSIGLSALVSGVVILGWWATSRVGKLSGAAVMLAGALVCTWTVACRTGLMPTEVAKPGEGIAWVHSVDEGLAEARRQGKPAILDFWASWCAECKVMDVRVFADADVIAESRRFVMIKVDMTRRTEETDRLQERFGVHAPPTFVFVRPDGSHRTEAGAQDKQAFLREMRRLR